MSNDQSQSGSGNDGGVDPILDKPSQAEGSEEQAESALDPQSADDDDTEGATE
jgi:hypothetical protein